MTDYSLRTTPLGRMTVRQLPIDDPSVDALPTTTRAILAEIWKRRMTAELHSSSTFAYLVDALTAIDAPPLLIDLARRAIDDERRHGEICGAMSSRYGGTAVVVPEPPPLLGVPRHIGADGRQSRILHVIAQGCCNETTATAFLERSMQAAEHPLPRAAMRELLADDLDHARLGWMMLAALDDEARADVEARLPELLVRNLQSWRTRGQFDEGPVMRAHGMLPWREVDELVIEAMRDLTVAGFAHAGFRVDAARAWLDEQQPLASSESVVASRTQISSNDLSASGTDTLG